MMLENFQNHKIMAIYVLWCAQCLEHLMDPKAVECLRVTERYIDGKATKKELDDAAGDATTSRAHASSHATRVAAYAATYTFAAFAAYASASARFIPIPLTEHECNTVALMLVKNERFEKNKFTEKLLARCSENVRAAIEKSQWAETSNPAPEKTDV